MKMVTIQLKFDPDRHSIKATPSLWPCKAWKFPRKCIDELGAKLPDDVAEFDVCGVYLLLSKESVYVGEAEQVITRLKQHAAKPPFDWEVSLAFTSKEQSLEKSHIKYLEHEIFLMLKAVGNYKIENTTTPTRSHVSDEDTMQAYLNYIVHLTEIFGYADVFIPYFHKRKPEAVRDTKDAEDIPDTEIAYGTFVEKKIKAQDIARHALSYAIENGFLSEEDISSLCSKDSARMFHAGGVPLLKQTNGDPSDCKDTHGLYRYNPKIITFEGRKYLISHELYNKPDAPQKDSRKPLLDYLVSRGMSLKMIFELCQENMHGAPQKKMLR